MSNKFTLDVGVNIENFRKQGPKHWVYQINERLEKAIGRISDSGGAGFGVRDGQWDFDTKEEAEEAYQAVGRAFGEMELEYVSIYETDEEGNPV
jgi:hypothetical protein